MAAGGYGSRRSPGRPDWVCAHLDCKFVALSAPGLMLYFAAENDRMEFME
jgi:hypothetical protein